MKHLKFFGLICLIWLTVLGRSQNTDSLVQVQVSINKITETQFSLAAHINIKPNWYVYQNNQLEGLNNIQINVDTLVFNQPGTVQILNNKVVEFKDPIFGNVHIIQGNFDLSQMLNCHEKPSVITGSVDFNIANKESFYPIHSIFTISLQNNADFQQQLLLTKITQPKADCGGTNAEPTGLLGIFILGFLGGLLALLTPCVFPMLPITVSFFTKKSSSRKDAIKNGLLYGLCILLMYLSVSLPFHIAGGVQPEIFNNLATNAILNLVFFAIFMFFAISFFGYYEISLPSGLASKVDSKKGLGSFGGIFFMALTLVIVSFSCTGPILGSLLVGSLTDGPWPLTMGLAGFGLALALPFGLFSMFPNFLQALPRSGSWLDSVKKILAFIELALALKFLSNADLVKHWGILKRETFLVVWILILIALIFYLAGFIRFPHEYKEDKKPVWKKIVLVGVTIFTIYIIGGLFQFNSLNALSGFPPPTNYSFHEQTNEHQNFDHILNDYSAAVALAKKNHKVILLDFTGWACVNCRKMEENVWTDPAVQDFLKNNCIITSLYVDDRTSLPSNQQFVFKNSDNSTKNILTQGDKWTVFESENFKQVSQPLYVMLNENEVLLNKPIAYTGDPKIFLEWLKCGYAVK